MLIYALCMLLCNQPRVVNGLDALCRGVCFQIRTARAVNYACSVVFNGQYARCANVTGLLLRTFNSVGCTSFFFIYRVLSPSGNVKVTPRLELRYFVGDDRRGDLLSFCLVIDSVQVLLQFVEFQRCGIGGQLQVKVKDDGYFTVNDAGLFFHFNFCLLRVLFQRSFMARRRTTRFRRQVNVFRVNGFILVTMGNVLIQVKVQASASAVNVCGRQNTVNGNGLANFNRHVREIRRIFTIAVGSFRVLGTKRIVNGFAINDLLVFQSESAVAVILPCGSGERTLGANPVSDFMGGTLKKNQFTVQDSHGAPITMMGRDPNCTYNVRIIYANNEESVFGIPLQFNRIVKRIAATAAKINDFKGTI